MLSSTPSIPGFSAASSSHDPSTLAWRSTRGFVIDVFKLYCAGSNVYVAWALARWVIETPRYNAIDAICRETGCRILLPGEGQRAYPELKMHFLRDPGGPRLVALAPIPAAEAQINGAPIMVCARRALATVAARVTTKALEMIALDQVIFTTSVAVQEYFTLDCITALVERADPMDLGAFSVHFGRTRVTCSADHAPHHPNAKYCDKPIDVIMMRGRARTVNWFMSEVKSWAKWIGAPMPVRVKKRLCAADVAGRAVE
ncbi:hypothetical protein GGF32_006670 [Allomyces javanicus]|nr:hypothetical protein GGF32_006670 [Allomyces javanicus]